MISHFLQTDFAKSLTQHIKNLQPIALESLFQGPKALVIKALQEELCNNILVVTSGKDEDILYQDLKYFNSNVFSFPSWELLLHEGLMPSPDLMGLRLKILHMLLDPKESVILLIPLDALLQRVLPQSTLVDMHFQLNLGDTISIEHLTKTLTELGYERTKLTQDKGQFSVRGGIVDIFEITAKEPARIEFFDDDIDDIRLFNPLSQKSDQKIQTMNILPAREDLLIKKSDQLESILDYLGENTLCIFDDILSIEDKYIQINTQIAKMPKFYDLFTDVLQATNKRSIFMASESLSNFSEASSTAIRLCNEVIPIKTVAHPFITIEDYYTSTSDNFNSRLNDILAKLKPDDSPLFLCDDATEKLHLEQIAKERKCTLNIEKGYLSNGFSCLKANLTVIPYTEFTKKRKISRESWRTTTHTDLSDFHQIEMNDLVVHFHNGIGKYKGIEKHTNHLGITAEFLVIDYAKGAKLFTPISESHLVTRYIGSDDSPPPLHEIGSSKWQKIKTQTEKSVTTYAQDLLKTAAAREIKGGISYPPNNTTMHQFSNHFPYQETSDQLKALEEIYSDMENNLPMDRLLCGDVGYGKTEVAMRAAFKASALGGKQVAILVPTTILAEQHFENFIERMKEYPINIGILSRFQSAKENKETLKKLALGGIDIIIGTHRLISKDVAFSNLGLIIIDEEQRFGVRVKEKLKGFKIGVDCLTLSATPIPRTLYFSLIKAKEMSLINSPPGDRLPIHSILCDRDDGIIRSAILREMARDGQVFFIHNRVETISDVMRHIEKLVPNANIKAVHGQMPADTIDSIFHQFKQGDIDVLVATTIVENGIDISNANTILIDQSHRFGLSELYQLRGRVGRWKKSAYCYFLVPPNQELKELSQKRLNALIDTSGFGGGIKLAMRDLELRGAGDILGTKQSGQIETVGFHLYCKMLKRTVEAMKKGGSLSFMETKIESNFIAKIPESYIADSSIRLEIYNRLGEAHDKQEIDAIFEEMIDRFGPLSESCFWLYALTLMRNYASKERFISLKFLSSSLLVEKKGSSTKQPEKKSFLLPPIKTPRELLLITLKKLSDGFTLPFPEHFTALPLLERKCSAKL